MRAHVILAHPEPKSFNAHLADEARAALAAQPIGPSRRPISPGPSIPRDGIHDLRATANDGRVYNLLEDGEPLRDLF